MRTAWRIALRYFMRRKGRGMVNIISGVSLVGVAVATAAMVCVLSVFNGFTELARETSASSTADLTVRPATGKVMAADSLVEALSGQDVRSVAVLREHGLAVNPATGRQVGVTLVGVGPGWQQTGVIDGNGEYGSVALPVGVAVDLEAHPGTPVDIYVPRRVGRINPANPSAAFRTERMAVGMVFQQNYDTSSAEARMTLVMPISVLRQMLDYTDGEGTEVQIFGNIDMGAVPEGMVALTRDELDEASMRIIKVEKWITFMMLVFILLIAAFNIISTLSMMVIEKERSTAILRALGMGPRPLRGIFVMEGWLISVVGGLCGLILGSALTLAQQWGGFIKLGGDHSMMIVTSYPVALEVSDLLAVGGVVLLTGFLTGLVSLSITRRQGIRASLAAAAG